MAYKIIWTDSASKDYQNIVDYLLLNWSFDIVMNFADAANEKIHTISQQPFIGLLSTIDIDVRSVLITKHNRLFYRISSNQIEILNIFDTRKKS
jgi:plasmid stabilization system protein ParE